MRAWNARLTRRSHGDPTRRLRSAKGLSATLPAGLRVLDDPGYLDVRDARKQQKRRCGLGRASPALSWEQAREEWLDAHREKFEKFLMETLSLPDVPV